MNVFPASVTADLITASAVTDAGFTPAGGGVERVAVLPGERVSARDGQARVVRVRLGRPERLQGFFLRDDALDLRGRGRDLLRELVLRVYGKEVVPRRRRVLVGVDAVVVQEALVESHLDRAVHVG
jgi:hypothetical protein